MHTAESDSEVWCTPRSLTPQCDSHCGAWLCSGMHTVELDSAGWCTTQSLTPQGDADRGVRLRGGLNTLSFLKVQISQWNRNRIWKYFSLFIRGLDWFESRKKWRSKISWHTPFQHFLGLRKLDCLLQVKKRNNNW